MTNTVFSSSSTRSKGFGQRTKRTNIRPSRVKKVKTFLILFGAVMRQTSAPRCCQEKYLSYLGKQLIYRGPGFLAQTRNYPIFGLRILGGDVGSGRETEDMFKSVRMRRNAEGINLPIFMGWYWNRLNYLSKVLYPTKRQVIEVSRILAVLSFSKFLILDGKKSLARAKQEYSQRIKTKTGRLPLRIQMRDDNPLYVEMVKYLAMRGHNKAGQPFKFDGKCYSLKCLLNKKPHRPPVPPVYGTPWMSSTLIRPSNPDGESKPKGLLTTINQWYYDKKTYDAKLTMITEAGGKYRGICPYTSPYAHSINLYKEAVDVLRVTPGICNFDQSRGHKVAKRQSLNGLTKVSVDASNFTDTINIEYAAYMAMALGASGAVHYHSKLRIKDFDGKIVNGCVPLMGWKGTFDLASLLLNFSLWYHLGDRAKGGVQCGDDYLGTCTLEEYQQCYEFLGLELSEQKTVISKKVTIFCGEMYWRGQEITPIRLLVDGLSDSNKYIGRVINRLRDFTLRNNYSTRAKRFLYRWFKKHLGERYNGYIDFRLSPDLGGIPLNIGESVALVPYLESKKIRLVHALCNIPIEKEDFDSYCTHFSHLPLGKPYSIYSMDTTLSPGSWPRKRRQIFNSRKKVVNQLISTSRADISDVLLYTYDSTPLKA